jgi:hypothetical protein
MGDPLAPRLSFIDGVDRPGEDFMKTVFEGLGNGSIGVAANSQRSVFYVVKVKDRDGTSPPPADVEGFQTMDDLRNQFVAAMAAERREFAARPYNLMMYNAFSRVQQEWMKAFDQRYGVEPDELPEMSAMPRRRVRR